MHLYDANLPIQRNEKTKRRRHSPMLYKIKKKKKIYSKNQEIHIEDLKMKPFFITFWPKGRENEN